jgi:hypothetical protein
VTGVRASEPTTWALVQPTARRREWELRRADELLAVLRIPMFRSGAQAEIGDRRLRIQRLGGLRGRYAVIDESTGGEVAGLRREGGQHVLEIDGLGWRSKRLRGRFGFVDDADQPLVAAKVRSGLTRSSGELSVDPGADERQAVLAALLACYLLIRRNEQAAAAASGTVAATAGG